MSMTMETMGRGAKRAAPVRGAAGPGARMDARPPLTSPFGAR
jgi:hypothetical protein